MSVNVGLETPPNSTGKCVTIEFGDLVSFIGMSVNVASNNDPLVPASALSSSSGADSPSLGFWVNPGYRIPDSTGKCVILEFGPRVRFMGFSGKVGI